MKPFDGRLIVLFVIADVAKFTTAWTCTAWVVLRFGSVW